MDNATWWVDLITRVGFPSAVAAFVLWRMENTLRDLIIEIRAFREVMISSTTSLEKHISERADFVVREVDHNLRAALPIVLRTKL